MKSAQRMLDAGFDEVIEKPIALDRLLAEVGRLSSKRCDIVFSMTTRRCNRSAAIANR